MSKRKMKDSGVEWLGEIPAEWDVRRGKTFLRLLSRPVKVDDDHGLQIPNSSHR